MNEIDQVNETKQEEQQKLLFAAVLNNNLDEAKKLLTEGVSPNGFCEPYLKLAVEFGYADMVKLLLSFGADIHIKSSSSQTPLHVAAMRGDLKTISCLVEAGIDINARDHSNNTALYKLVEMKRKEAVLLLLANGADIYVTLYGEPMLDAVNRLLGKDIPVVETSKDVGGNPIYRQADQDGNPLKTFQEKKYDATFKGCTSFLVAQSLFKENKSIADAMKGLSQCLDEKQIKNASEVSKVVDDQGNVSNGSRLGTADVEAAKASGLLSRAPKMASVSVSLKFADKPTPPALPPRKARPDEMLDESSSSEERPSPCLLM